ncbi:ABC transporter ATP-binding protein [Ruegeria lacuscaerulensis]|uniref:ABC transporter ATP-binding protein n=1 Tax=Ruegeria lacuscaerulensis TaxID=55218 RepID=UPI00147D6E07|nr:ABC transporter ATP-binding protein [Ruegeria lacuscaerulensis]
MTALLEINDLGTGYGDVKVLHGVSIALEKGKVTAVLGANGAGKTTLFRTIAGLLPCMSGRVRFQGEDIGVLASHKRVEKGVVLVPEGRLVFPDLTVAENLRLGAINVRARAHSDDTLKTVMALFPRLEERKSQYAGTLSGGEQQMLALGRGLMAMPRVLLLDEPTLGLAPGIAKQIFSTIPELLDFGLSILIAEQDVRSTLKIADYGYVLENGLVGITGDGESLVRSPLVAQAFLGH